MAGGRERRHLVLRELRVAGEMAAHREASATPSVNVSVVRAERRLNIVVIDDDLLVMQLCVEVLEQDGHRVEGFTRGEDALIRLATQPTDLLVVDRKMPGLNGFEVIRRARSLRPDLRVVMITGDGSREILGEAIQIGVNGIILKPFTPDDLRKGAASAVGHEAKPPA